MPRSGRGREAAGSGVGFYVALAGLFFSLNTMQLLFLPNAAHRAGLGSLGIGIIISGYTGVGIFSDLPAGELANRRGVPVTVLIGCGLTALGTACFLESGRLWSVIAGALLLGVATSFMMNPILGGLSDRAGNNQLHWQLLNVCVQRIGGLIAVIALATSGMTGGVTKSAVASLICTLTIAGIALGLRSGNSASDAAGVLVPVSWRRLLGRALMVVAQSREAMSGLVLELLIPAMLVFGFSFLPMLQASLTSSISTGALLVTREAVGIGTVVLVVVVLRPRHIAGIMYVVLSLGAATMPLLAYASTAAGRMVAMGVNGAVVTVGILAANLHVYHGTVPATRMYGFAMAGIVSRISGVVFPVIYGWSAELSAQALVWCASATVALVGILYACLQSGRNRAFDAPGDAAGCPRAAPSEG